MKLGLCVIVLLLILSGCTDIGIANDGNTGNTKIVPVPDDIYRYQTFVTLKDGGIEKTTFALLESKVNVNSFCAGCYGQYYLTFWNVPDTIDYYIGDKLKGNRTTDTAILSKPLYKNDNLGNCTYLDNIWEIVCTYGNGTPIEDCNPKAVSYTPATRELLIGDFKPNSQVYFSVTYFHSLPQRYEVCYNPPGKDIEEGYVYDPRAADWIIIPDGQQTQIVPPFTIRHVPVILKIPSDTNIASSHKFEFYITVKESVTGVSTAVQSLVGYNQRWLVSCR